MYLALPVSSGRFPRAIRVSRYSRTETKKIIYFHLRGHYPLGLCFPAHSVNILFCNFSRNRFLGNYDVSALQPLATLHYIRVARRLTQTLHRPRWQNANCTRLRQSAFSPRLPRAHWTQWSELGLGFCVFARRYLRNIGTHHKNNHNQTLIHVWLPKHQNFCKK